MTSEEHKLLVENNIMLKQVWLDKSTRVGLINSLTIEKNAGKEISTLWFGNLKRIFVNSNFNDGATVAGIFSTFNTSSTAYAFATIETTSTNSIYTIYAN